MAAMISAERAREKVLDDDDELESIESVEQEEDALQYSNFLADTLKQSLQRVGKDLEDCEYFVDASAEMLELLCNLMRNHLPGTTQAANILNSYPCIRWNHFLY